MDAVLPLGIKANLRFAANYRLHKAYLLELDRTRFGGLGEDGTKAFVRHGMELGDSFNLRFVEEVQYLLFMMYFLGSHFHEDPRYAALARILNRPVSADDRRIEECHELFAEFSERYLADDLSEYVAALEKFGASADNIFEHANPTALSLDAFYSAFDMTPKEREDFPAEQLIRLAAKIARQLGFSDQRGTAVCLSLSFWMGTGFHHEPLYPWVQDILKDAGQKADDREEAVLNYARKRMKRQISALKAHAQK